MKYIIAYGNKLRSDDGVGSHIIAFLEEKQLQKKNLNKEIYLVDLANNAWGILPLLNSDSKKILIIDCAYMGKSPGSFGFFSLADISNQPRANFEAHGNSLIQLINTANRLDYKINDIVFMGIEPDSLAIGQCLSAVIESNIEKYADAAVNAVQES